MAVKEGKVGGSRKKFSNREKRAKGQVRLHRAHGSVEWGKAVSGSATQALWLQKGKVRSQVGGLDQSRLHGRRMVGKVRRGGRLERRASDRAKKGVFRFR